ncbi:MAG: molecular chaperone DnaK [Clostridia bacterium]|nr:molecular chaperone DnaK [Deltaproteobacteria bacterium]
MSKIIGIDLGTTNSCVAVVERDRARVLTNRQGHTITPSVVAVTEAGKRLVGQLAKRQGITNPHRTVHGAKRLIGRRWDVPEVQRAVSLASFSCVQGPHDDVRVQLGNRQYAMPEIASMVLQEMRLVAEQQLGEPVTQAVVTVPAYFNDNQRQATKDAGAIAGLDIVRIINEPTAAALAYGFGKGLEQRVAIYDFGGGTFDISILEIGQGVFEVLSTAGDTFLGGEDFDERIIDWLRAEFVTENGIDLRTDKMALQRLRDAAERTKIELSQTTETDINLPFIASPPGSAALHLQRKMTRDKLLELTGDLIERSMTICEKAFQSANLKVSDVKAVILVGGMTRMPRVQQRVQEFFGKAPSKGVHPDEVVAQGAAIQGELLASKSTETLLLDVTPHNLGIVVAGGLFDTIIQKDTTIPTSEAKQFTTIRDNQTQVRIIVMQGDVTEAKKNELLGEFLLDGLKPAPKGEVQINVTFSISADGIVSVAARDSDTGREQTIEVTAASGLTQVEIADMTAENQDYVQAFEAPTEASTERTELDELLALVSALMPQVESVIAETDFGVDAMKKTRGAVERAQAAIASGERDAMALAKGPLSRALSLFKTVTAKLKHP